MSGEVEHVAVWVGLIIGLAGVTVSVVAMVFTWAVNARTEKLNDATIEALTHISGDVADLREQTKDLIRETWSKFVTPGADAVGPDDVDLPEPTGETGAIPPPAAPSMSRRGTTSAYLRLVEGLSSEARELLRIVARGSHLTAAQRDKLAASPLASAVDELERAELLVPLRAQGSAEAVYWLRPGLSKLTSVLKLLAPEPSGIMQEVRTELAQVGYTVPGRPPENHRGDRPDPTMR